MRLAVGLLLVVVCFGQATKPGPSPFPGVSSEGGNGLKVKGTLKVQKKSTFADDATFSGNVAIGATLPAGLPAGSFAVGKTLYLGPCTGTDDQAALQAAATYGGEIVLPEGTCVFTAPITVSNALTLRGKGQAKSILQAGNLTTDGFQIATTQPFWMHDLTIQSATLQTAGTFVTITGPGGSSTNYRSKVENVEFRGCYDCLLIGIADQLRVEANQFMSHTHRAIIINNTQNGDQGDNVFSFNWMAADPGHYATVEGIEQVAGGGVFIINKFFQHHVAYHLNWASPNGTAQLQLIGNRCEAMGVGGACFRFELAPGNLTGTVSGLIMTGNWMRADVGVAQTLIDGVAATRNWSSGWLVTGNYMEVKNASTAINLRGYTGTGAHITGNLIYGTVGTSAGIVIGANYDELKVYPNDVLGTATPYSISSGLRGDYSPDKMGVGVSPNTDLTYRLSIPNNEWIAARNTTDSGWVQLLGLDGSGYVSLSPGGTTVLTGGSVQVGDALVPAATGQSLGQAAKKWNAHLNSLQVNEGDAITSVAYYDATLTPAAVGANTTAEQTFDMTGLNIIALGTSDSIIVNGPAPTAGTALLGCRVAGSNSMACTFGNFTAAPLTPAAGSYKVLAFRHP